MEQDVYEGKVGFLLSKNPLLIPPKGGEFIWSIDYQIYEEVFSPLGEMPRSGRGGFFIKAETMKVNLRSGREGVNDNDEKSQDVIQIKKGQAFASPFFYLEVSLFHFFNNSLKSFRMIHCKVGEGFSV
jgi:hypothetical protein